MALIVPSIPSAGGNSSSSVTLGVSSTTNISSRVGIWYREGRFMHIDGVITWNGAGSDGGVFTVTVPDSQSIDTDELAGGTDTTNAGSSRLGGFSFFNSGTAFFSGDVQYTSTTTFSFTAGSALTGTTFANGDGLKFNVKIPISGW